MDDIRRPIPEAPTRFIHLLRRDMRDKGYAYRTKKAYVHWVTRYIRFHGKQHPKKLGAEHINQFLSYLANEQNCAPATGIDRDPRSNVLRRHDLHDTTLRTTEIYTHVLGRGAMGVISPVDR